MREFLWSLCLIRPIIIFIILFHHSIISNKNIVEDNLVLQLSLKSKNNQKMKKISLILLTLFVALQFNAQDVFPKPEYSNVLYVWNKKDNNLKETEKKNPNIKTGLGGKFKYEVEGKSSNVKISSTKKPSFIYSSDMALLANNAKLYKVKVKKGKRMFEPVTLGIGKADMDGDAMDFRTKKLEENTYELVPENDLEKGEYAVYGLLGNSIFLFSIQ